MSRNIAPFSIRNRFIFIIDVFVVILSHLLVLMLVTDYYELIDRFFKNINLVVISCTSYELVLFASRMYRTYWSYAGTKDYIRLIAALGVASFLSLVLEYIFKENVRFLLCFISDGFAASGILFVRVAIRGLNRLNRSYHAVNPIMKRTLIVGAGQYASTLIKEIQISDKMNYKILGLIDDDEKKKNYIVGGYKVFGNVQDIPKIVNKKEICDAENPLIVV